MILGSGELELTLGATGEKTTLTLSEPGELSTILGFVGGDVSQVSVGVVARTACAILVLDRARFAALLNSHPAVVYYVMRGLVRYVHGMMSRLNAQTMAMTRYLYSAMCA